MASNNMLEENSLDGLFEVAKSLICDTDYQWDTFGHLNKNELEYLQGRCYEYGEMQTNYSYNDISFFD